MPTANTATNKFQLIKTVGAYSYGLFLMKFTALPPSKCLSVYFTSGPAAFLSQGYQASSLAQFTIKTDTCTADSGSGSFQSFSVNAFGQLQSTAQVFPSTGGATSVCLGEGSGAALVPALCSTKVYTNRFALVNPSAW